MIIDTCVKRFQHNKSGNGMLAKLLAEFTPGDLTKTFFSAGDAQANEAAILICRQVTGKFNIIGRYRSYHGAASASMTVCRVFLSWSNVPDIPGVAHALDAYPYRCQFWCNGGSGRTSSDCNLRCANYIEDIIRMQGGRRHVAGLI